MSNSFNKGRYIAGAVIILIGAALLVKNLNLLPFEIPPYVFTWKMLLVALGIFMLIKKKWIAGSILISIGAYLLLPEAIGISKEEMHSYWPAFLILWGFIILIRPKSCWKKPVFKSINENMDYMETTVIFGGGSKQVSSYDFKGGKITTIFGGQEIDLTNCCLSKEKNIIELEVVCGGVELKVPKEWNVQIDVTPIMGGIEDNINNIPDTYVDPAALLIIRGTVVMGGVEIKRV